jgi:hypothetical protein
MTTEQHLSRALRIALSNVPIGSDIAEAPSFREISAGLEFFLPSILKEIYPVEWKWESLDGVLPVFARKTGELEVEIFGLCILISDQALTPIHLVVQVSPSEDEVSFLECKLGEREGNKLRRTPYRQVQRQISELNGRQNSIDWIFKVTFGQRI